MRPKGRLGLPEEEAVRVNTEQVVSRVLFTPNIVSIIYKYAKRRVEVVANDLNDGIEIFTVF